MGLKRRETVLFLYTTTLKVLSGFFIQLYLI